MTQTKYVIAEPATEKALELSLRDRTPVFLVLIEDPSDAVASPTSSASRCAACYIVVEKVWSAETVGRTQGLEILDGELLIVGTDTRGRRVEAINAIGGPLHVYRER